MWPPVKSLFLFIGNNDFIEVAGLGIATTKPIVVRLTTARDIAPVSLVSTRPRIAATLFPESTVIDGIQPRFWQYPHNFYSDFNRWIITLRIKENH